MVDSCADHSELQIITRWDPSSLLSGATDAGVFPYLDDLAIPLYIHPSIHLKLYVFDDSTAFHSSGNITSRGLGLSAHSNIEVGCLTELTQYDWGMILNLLEDSTRVTADVYARARKYVEDNAAPPPPSPPLDLALTARKPFSRLSLPASPDPCALFRFYRGDRLSEDESITAYAHDIILYHLPSDLDESSFYAHLGEAFTTHPFIESVVQLLREEKEARFGLVNGWITNLCADTPTPYRWELKPATRRLYDWLAHFFDDIEWSRPRHSMILRSTHQSRNKHD